MLVGLALLTLHIGAFMRGLIRLASEPRLGLLSSLGLRRRFSLAGIWIGCLWRRDSEMAVLGISPDFRTPPPVYWASAEALPEPDKPKSFFASTTIPPPGNVFLQAWFFSALFALREHPEFWFNPISEDTGLTGAQFRFQYISQSMRRTKRGT